MASPQARESIGRSSGATRLPLFLPGHVCVAVRQRHELYRRELVHPSSTHSTVKVSLQVIVVTLPGLLVPFLGGVLIDRLDRRYLACCWTWLAASRCSRPRSLRGAVTWSFGICMR